MLHFEWFFLWCDTNLSYKNDNSVKESPAYCQSFFDGLLIVFMTDQQTDGPTDLCIKAPSRSLKNSSETICVAHSVQKRPNTSLAAKGALTHRLQHRTACKIQNGRQGVPKWQTGSGKVFNNLFLRFFHSSTPSMRKVGDGEKKKGKKIKDWWK